MAMEQDEQSTIFRNNQKITTWIEHFLLDRTSANLSPHSVTYYRNDLRNFTVYCQKMGKTYMEEIQPDTIRGFILELAEKGHKPGGQAGHYRAIKSFFNFYEREMDLPSNKNPIRKVKAPKVPENILPPIEMSDVEALLAVCGNGELGKRDKAIILALLDTGARGSELMAVKIKDYNVVTGEIRIENGKGGKTRIVYAGPHTRKALRAYLAVREKTYQNDGLFTNSDGEQLTYWGLRLMLTRKAKIARLENIPSPHDFRRAFCINALRSGMSMAVLRRTSGHSDYQVLQRYLRVTDEDAKLAHAQHSPVELLFKK